MCYSQSDGMSGYKGMERAHSVYLLLSLILFANTYAKKKKKLKSAVYLLNLGLAYIPVV